jgi:8-oxo-dGTP diphosphatase
MSGNSRGGRTSAFASIDIVLCTPQGRHLAVLLVRDRTKRAREKWSLPWTPADGTEDLDEAAARLTRSASGARATWIAQAGAFPAANRHPANAEFSIGYVCVAPEAAAEPPKDAKWFSTADLPRVAPRHGAIIDAALLHLRERMDRAPVAFRLLGATFTLTDLQAIYELLLGRRLHKASFRRSLQAAFLVEPTDEWRSEGRGRPAQLFRYAPRKRRGGRGGVRFELLGG